MIFLSKASTLKKSSSSLQIGKQRDRAVGESESMLIPLNGRNASKFAQVRYAAGARDKLKSYFGLAGSRVSSRVAKSLLLVWASGLSSIPI